MRLRKGMVLKKRKETIGNKILITQRARKNTGGGVRYRVIGINGTFLTRELTASPREFQGLVKMKNKFIGGK